MTEPTPEPVAAPRRMNAAAVMETMSGLLEAAVTRAPAEPSVSVECDDTAKGDTTPTVKIYAPAGCDLDALEAHAKRVAEIAVQTHKEVREQFPRVSA